MIAKHDQRDNEVHSFDLVIIPAKARFPLEDIHIREQSVDFSFNYLYCLY